MKIYQSVTYQMCSNWLNEIRSREMDTSLKKQKYHVIGLNSHRCNRKSENVLSEMPVNDELFYNANWYWECINPLQLTPVGDIVLISTFLFVTPRPDVGPDVSHFICEKCKCLWAWWQHLDLCVTQIEFFYSNAPKSFHSFNRIPKLWWKKKYIEKFAYQSIHWSSFNSWIFSAFVCCHA